MCLGERRGPGCGGAGGGGGGHCSGSGAAREEGWGGGQGGREGGGAGGGGGDRKGERALSCKLTLRERERERRVERGLSLVSLSETFLYFLFRRTDVSKTLRSSNDGLSPLVSLSRLSFTYNVHKRFHL